MKKAILKNSDETKVFKSRCNLSKLRPQKYHCTTERTHERVGAIFLSRRCHQRTMPTPGANTEFRCSSPLRWACGCQNWTRSNFDNVSKIATSGTSHFITNERLSSITCIDVSSIRCFNSVISSKPLWSSGKFLTTFSLNILSKYPLPTSRDMQESVIFEFRFHKGGNSLASGLLHLFC